MYTNAKKKNTRPIVISKPPVRTYGRPIIRSKVQKRVYSTDAIASKKSDDTLIKETHQASKDLGVVISNRDTALSEVSKLKNELIFISGEIEKKRLILEAFDKDIAHRKSLIDDINRSNDIIVSAHRVELSSLIDQIDIVKKEIEKKELQRKEFSDLSSSIDVLNKQAIYLTSKRDSIMKTADEVNLVLASRESNLNIREAEIDDKIKRNGIILTKTEGNLRQIEHYVKRLQRYYDEVGLKINILPVFGIRRDNNPQN